MEKKKAKIGAAVYDAGKNAANLLGKAKKAVVNAMDQNDDGELTFKDVSVAANSIGGAAKKAAATVKDNAAAHSREQALKALAPIFSTDLDNTDFLMTKLIRVTEMDKKRMENEVCQGSIGYATVQKGLKIINVFRNKTSDFGITLYPDNESEIYYVDPSDRDRYIALDNHFGYLKVARINELQKIAQDLGAKHFKVTYKEQRTSQANAKVKGQAKGKLKAQFAAEHQHEVASTEYSAIEIAAEMTCPGHPPVKPQLVYLQREPSIASLIELRMDANSPITHQKYTLKLSNSSGIKTSDAVKIDAALKAMKYTGSITVTTEAQNEARRFLEYEVDF